MLPALVVPVAAGLIALFNKFDGLYGQDAFAYFDYATVSLRSQIYPPPPFYWPPGYPILILITSTIIGVTPLAGQIISLLMGGLVVLFTTLITYEIWRPDGQTRWIAAVTAGLAVGVVGQLWQSSAVIMADTTSLATCAIGVWALARYGRLMGESGKANPYWLALAAGAMAYATITRWGYAAVALVCLVYTLSILYPTFRTDQRQTAIHVTFASVVASIILLPVLIPALTASDDETTFGGNFGYQFQSWNPVNAFQRDFKNPDGYQHYKLANGIYYGTLPARTFYFAPMLAVFVVPGLLAIYRYRSFGAFFLVAGWGVAAYLLLIGGPQQNVRFALMYTPPVGVLIGVGVSAVYGWFSRWRYGTYVIACFVGIGLVWASVSGYRWTQDFIDRQENDKAVVRWAERQIPPNARVIAFGVTLTMQHYTNLETHEIYYLTADDLIELTDAGRETYLIADVYNVETQWRDGTPGVNYRWLESERGLEKIGQQGAFSLFRVGDS
jgi:hypothetical protein